MTETETVKNNIAPALREAGLVGPIAELHAHPQNYRQGDVESIRASLRRFGQLRPVLIQKSTMNVVAGNHTMKSATEEGWDEIARVIVEMDDAEAEAYLVADNRTSDKAENDNERLTAILERLMLAGRLEGTGYSPDDVDDMLAAMAALPEVEPEPTQAAASVDDEQLAERFKNRSQVALRQFVLMYPQDGTSDEVEAMANRLKRAWGVTSMADVVREALTRATAEPPVEGLTDEERAAADAPTPVEEPAATSNDPAPDLDRTPGAEAGLPKTGPDPADPPAVEPATTEGAAGSTGVEPQVPADPAVEVPPTAEPGSTAAFEADLPGAAE